MNDRAACVWQESGGCKALTVKRWQESGVYAFFTARQGGSSQGAYASMNLGLHVEDDPQTVCRNREQLAAAFGLPVQRMVFCEQVHETDVFQVNSRHCGRGVYAYADALPHTDAVITSEPEVYLTLLYADCIPIFFFDPTVGAVGLAHGGWKGLWGEIGRKTVEAMQEAFGCRAENLECWIGPGIDACCFEISWELAEKVMNRPGWKTWVHQKPDGQYVWDLKQNHRQVLMQSGVLSENITVSENCTSCETGDFFSYRKEQGKTGRMAAIIGLREPYGIQRNR